MKQVNGFSVGGTAVSFPNSLNSPQSILDSGTTAIVFGDQSNYNALLTAIQNSGLVTFSSSVSAANIASFWAGSVAFGSSSVTINSNVQTTISFAGPSGSVTISIPGTNWIDYSGGYIGFSVFLLIFLLFSFLFFLFFFLFFFWN